MVNAPTNHGAAKRLPWIDRFVMPLIFVGVLVLIIVTLGVLRRKLFASAALDERSQGCMVTNDPVRGSYAHPNTTCAFRESDAPLTEYRFNNCGERSDIPCGPKAPGTYRIVLLGTSYAQGTAVPWEKTFAATLPLELSKITGRTVELENRALEWQTPRVVDQNFQDTLNLKPDLILYTLDGWDITHSAGVALQDRPKSFFTEKQQNRKGIHGKIARTIDYIKAGKLTMDAVLRPFQPDVWCHYLYNSQSIYIRQSLLGEVDYLQTKPSAEWRKSLEVTATYLADLEQRSKAAGVPLVVTVLPHAPQATMISMGEWPEGYDPYLLGNQIHAMVEKDGGIYIDMLSGFRSLPNAERLYYPLNNHPNPDGQQEFSHALARNMSSGVVPELRAKTQDTTKLEIR